MRKHGYMRLLLKVVCWAQRKRIKVEDLTREQILEAISCKHA